MKSKKDLLKDYFGDDKDMDQGEVDEDDQKEVLKEALKDAKKAQSVSVIMLDENDGSVQAVHVGGTSVRDTLRLVIAHRSLADNLEKAITQGLGMDAKRLAHYYEEIGETTSHHALHNEFEIHTKGRIK